MTMTHPNPRVSEAETWMCGPGGCCRTRSIFHVDMTADVFEALTVLVNTCNRVADEDGKPHAVSMLLDCINLLEESVIDLDPNYCVVRESDVKQ